MKLSVSNINVEYQEVEIKKVQLNRRVAYYQKRGWTLVGARRSIPESEMMTIKLERRTTPTVAIEP